MPRSFSTSVLVEVMPWRRTNSKIFPEQVMILFNLTYMCSHVITEPTLWKVIITLYKDCQGISMFDKYMLNINFDNQVNIWIWGYSDVNRYLISQGHQGHGSLGNGNLLSQTDTGARSLAISQQIMKCLSSSILSQYVRRRSLTSTLVCRPRSISKPCSEFCQYILC